MAKAQSIVFYSWQSDLPNATNRGFIEEALKKAVKTIQSDESIQTVPIIDRDTSGVPGSPDIASTIFGKIDQAQVFVCDISIINYAAIKQLNARPVPNPNVLIELGYALKALGDKGIIMLFNDVYGDLNLLPFDLYTRRAVTYHMPKEAEERAPERNRLAAILTDALSIILNELDKHLPGEPIEPLSLAERAQIAIKAEGPEQTGLIRQYMSELANKIAERNPAYLYSDIEHCSEQLMEAINVSTELVVEFARLAESLAARDARQAIKAMYKGFEDILNLYTFSPGYEGQQKAFVPDLARFLGHELFVIFFSCLLRNERWRRISEILDEDLYARTKSAGQPSMVSFHHLSENIRLFYDRNDLPGIHQISLHPDILKERHTQGELGKLVSIEQFIEADYFLFLRAQIQPVTADKLPIWMPWSSLHMRQVPRYIQEAKRIKYAQRLLDLLGVEDIQTLRTRLVERTGSLEKGWGYTHFRLWDNIVAGFDFSTIGTL